ncbi:MAG: tRNA (adenosine(37)-N6)-dimethylallyltransferase MiaA [Vallitaleaceae bacterium]|jgi:tRNA dimethylallyltransferase|nr:tRNA (adenosine(37)-N6)-dimethylallyltransferase MiaA [Vallitaleaceae bacterium]
MKKPLIVIAGPTASGKTGLSIKLAQAINGAIISGDSMQIYKSMDIGTAKVMPDEMGGIDHYLIDELVPSDPYNVHLFQKKAKEAMRTIYTKGQIPIIVGGTGFYIQSIVYDIEFDDTLRDDAYRACLEKLARTMGAVNLHEKLKACDMVSYETIHPNNVKRVIRALEYYHETGKPISSHNMNEAQKESPYNLLFYVLTMDRTKLYSRIDTRVDRMIEAGLVEEVEKLKSKGYHQGMVSMQGIGYKEILDFLDGKIDISEATLQIKRDSRRFAKRQLTWFRREKIAKWLDIDAYDMNYEIILEKVLKDIEVNQLL